MDKKQLALLFVCGLVGWTVGNGLMPILPVIALELGADEAVTGYYMAFSYLALTFGTLAAGWISDRWQKRKFALVLSPAATLPALWLMGQVTTFWQLAALTAIVWFFGGMGLATVTILAGLSAGETERGRVFGILGLTGGLGAIIGGLGVGTIATGWGYSTMFTAFAAYLVLWVAAALFVQDKRTDPAGRTIATGAVSRTGLGRAFHLLFASILVLAVGTFVGMLCRSLMMDAMGFDAAAITGTVAIAGAVVLPFSLLLGWLSDKVGRKLILYACYGLGFVSLALLALASLLWQFWLAMSLMFLMSFVAGAVGAALTSDLVPEAARGRGLAWLSASSWIGAIIGFAFTGVAVQSVGAVPTLLAAALLPLLGIGFLIPIQADKHTPPTPTALSTPNPETT